MVKEVKINQNGHERIVKINGITTDVQEQVLTEAQKLDEEGDAVKLLKFLRKTVVDYSDITDEEYGKLESSESRKLVKEVMKLVRPFSAEEDF